jgi:hypothetical protein
MANCEFDSNKAVAWGISDDGQHKTPICIFHYLRWVNDAKTKVQLKRGVKLRLPIEQFSHHHQMERAYLVGMEGDWRCTVCGLRVHGGMWAPSLGDTCPGERHDWKGLI